MRDVPGERILETWRLGRAHRDHITPALAVIRVSDTTRPDL
jgi:hypothetical protein